VRNDETTWLSAIGPVFPAFSICVIADKRFSINEFWVLPALRIRCKGVKALGSGRGFCWGRPIFLNSNGGMADISGHADYGYVAMRGLEKLASPEVHESKGASPELHFGRGT
jgi:hypothetical protein